jgi:hypothetical protein
MARVLFIKCLQTFKQDVCLNASLSKNTKLATANALVRHKNQELLHSL